MFDQLVEDGFAALWALDPAAAVYLGKHEYDGKVPDWSADTVAAHLAELVRLSGELLALGDLDDFHDRLLSRGAPPVEMMRRVMLP